MNSLHLENSWELVKEKLKEQNVELTDEDLEFRPGKEEELIDRLSTKLRKEPSAIKAWIESISSNKGKAS
jgi:cytochrome c-type biogenesis protein CcmH/NrfG